MANQRRLEGRIALITGASRGIGAAVAKAYGAEGAQLILLARTVGGLEEVDDAVRKSGGSPATLVPLDITDGDGIDRMGAALFERYGRLDILVGNAGALGTLTPTSHVEPKIWQQTMEINTTANARLIRSMDPLLRQSDAARAIFVTSGVTNMNPPYWAAYAASKAALEALVKCWAGELNKTNMRVNLLDPGVVSTAMRARAFPGENPQTLPHPDTVVEAFIQMALPNWTGNGERIETSSIT